MTENIYQEMRELRKDFESLRTEMVAIRRALLGDDYDGSGLTQVVGRVVVAEKGMREELHAIRQDQKRRREISKQQRQAAAIAGVVVLVLAWLLSTLLIAELRHGVGVGAAEARFIATLLIAVITIAGGFAGAAFGPSD